MKRDEVIQTNAILFFPIVFFLFISSVCVLIENEMEEVTDKFYSHFPSYTEQQRRERELLAQNRRKDYQNYLKQMSLNDDIISRTAIERSLRKPANVDDETTKNRSGGETIVTRAIIESRSKKFRWGFSIRSLRSNQIFVFFSFFYL